MVRATLMLAVLALLLGGVGQEKADPITSLAGGTEIPMPQMNYFGPGPQTFGPDITWSSTNSTNQGGSVFGSTLTYGLYLNGYWDGSLGPMAGVNDSKDAYGITDTMTFAFSTPVSAVGGFINYVPDSLNPTTIAVYDSGHNLIESLNLSFLTGGGANTGQFLGFQESTANISYFTLTDNYVVLTDLTILQPSTSVPEPSSIIVMGLGIVGAVAYSRQQWKGTAA